MYTNLDWTIIRPGPQVRARHRHAVLTDDIKASGVINRADVAALVTKALESEARLPARSSLRLTLLLLATTKGSRLPSRFRKLFVSIIFR